MRIIETQAYTFDELSDDVKEKVIEKFREDKYEYLDISWFSDDCTHHLSEQGFIDTKLQYSLGNCQGDGLSFEADEYTKLKDLYLQELGKGKEKTAQLLADNTMFVCTGNKGYYCFASESDVDIYIDNYNSSINTDCENINEVVNNVLCELQCIYIDLCSKLEKNYYDEIEYQQSDECIIEDIQCNEYEFTKDGKLI